MSFAGSASTVASMVVECTSTDYGVIWTNTPITVWCKFDVITLIYGVWTYAHAQVQNLQKLLYIATTPGVRRCATLRDGRLAAITEYTIILQRNKPPEGLLGII